MQDPLGCFRSLGSQNKVCTKARSIYGVLMIMVKAPGILQLSILLFLTKSTSIGPASSGPPERVTQGIVLAGTGRGMIECRG